jgi:hypothetical protein
LATPFFRVLNESGYSIASKNNEADALAELERFGLREYFVFPAIGWGPKSDSIRRIKQAFNVGEDTIAFIDYQPFEREEVLTRNPKVTGSTGMMRLQVCCSARNLTCRSPLRRASGACFIRVRPISLCVFTKSSEHKPNGSELDEGERDPGQVLEVFGEPVAAAEPSESSLDDPSFRQDLKALGSIGPLDDFHLQFRQNVRHRLLELRSLIAQTAWTAGERRRRGLEYPPDER